MLNVFCLLPVIVVSSQPGLHAEKILADAVSTWPSYVEKLSNLDGACTTTITTDNLLLKRFTVQFRTGRQSGLTISTRESRRVANEPFQSRGSVIGANSRYAFQLERPPGGVEGVWLLRSLNPGGYDPVEFEKQSRLASEAYQGIPVSIENRKLADLVMEPTFKVLGVESVPRDSTTPAVRLVFDNTHPPSPRYAGVPIQRGSVDLDPQRDWVVIGYSVIWHDGDAVIGTNEYGEAIAGIAPPVRSRSVGDFVGPTGKKSKSIVERTFSFQTPSERLTEEQASLPAFGLEEPAQLAPKKWYARWQVVLAVVVSLILITIGAVLRRRVPVTP